jgi:C4-dicarboxylate transporter DctQ subunit
MSDTVSEKGRISTLEFVENTIVTTALGIMIVVIFLQIFLRYLSAELPVESIRDAAQFLLPWSEEVARYCMIWAVFIGAGIGAKSGVHVGVDAVVRLLPHGAMKSAIVFSGLCSTAFCLALMGLGVMLLNIMWDTGQVSPALEMPMVYAYLAVPAGGLLTALRFFQAMLNQLRSLNASEGGAV